MRLRRASHTVTRWYDQAFETTGLSATQFSLLRSISRLEQSYISRLAEASGLERSTLGRNLKTLEKSGLVILSQGDDARTRQLRLSQKGNQVLDEALNEWQVAQDKLTQRLGATKLNTLEALLDELLAD